MATCEVCGAEFKLEKKNHYVAGGTCLGMHNLYDAFDCPMCGSQYIAKTRKPEWLDVLTLKCDDVGEPEPGENQEVTEDGEAG